jgi:hypothetical protein
MKLSDVLKRLPVYDPRARCAEAKPSRFARKAEARADRRAAVVKRDKHRTRIYVADMGKCRSCGRKVYLKIADAPHELAVGHVHEWVPRSLGGDPLDPLNCLLLCSECHPKIQGDVGGRELLIVALDIVRLMRGPVEVIPNAAITLLIG